MSLLKKSKLDYIAEYINKVELILHLKLYSKSKLTINQYTVNSSNAVFFKKSVYTVDI